MTQHESRPCWYPDRAVQVEATIVENVPVAEATFRIRFRAPQIARRIVPGQFLMVRIAGWNDPLLARPLALYDVVYEAGAPALIDVMYLVGGKFTKRLAEMTPGQPLDVWGPLGNGFEPRPTPHLVMVAGGIGQTPFLALAREHLGLARYGDPPREAARVPKITLCYGVRRRALLAGVADFERLGVDVRISTDDGSSGLHGFTTDLLRQVLAEQGTDCRIVCCGPEPMMEAIAHLAGESKVPCEVSLESPMACGLGICFSCVVRVRDGDGWDFRRTCVEGPVFDAHSIVW